MEPNPIRILIADDHAIFRDGLRRLLATQEDFQVIAEASDGKDAIALATELKQNVDQASEDKLSLEVIRKTDEIEKLPAGQPVRPASSPVPGNRTRPRRRRVKDR